MKEKIEEFLKQNNYNAKGIENHFKKCQFLARTTGYRSGIIKIQDNKYYFNCIYPWLMCPDGKIEVEIMH